MASVIVSFKEDSALIAGRVKDYFAKRVGESGVVLGVSNLVRPGDDYLEAIDSAVLQSSLLVILIGPGWSNGGWLTNPNDLDSVTIAAALKNSRKIVPLLVDGGILPPADSFHPDLAGLARRAAISVHSDSFAADIQALDPLLNTLTTAPKAAPASPVTPPSAQPVNAPPAASGYAAAPAGYAMPQSASPYYGQPPASPYGAVPYPMTRPQNQNTTFIVVAVLLVAAVAAGIFFLTRDEDGGGTDSASLSSGFSSPYTTSVRAGGSNSLSNSSGIYCNGYAGTDPDFRLDYETFSSNSLYFYFYGDTNADTTMAVRDPFGSWYCDDDSYLDYNPLVSISVPYSGTYEVWVGTYRQGNSESGTLYVSEYYP